MANWSLPALTDLYTNFRKYISDRLDDAAKMFDSALVTATNLPAGTKRWNSTSNKFEKWSGSAWSNLASTYGISISGNAATATTADTATTVTTVTSANVIVGLGYTPANIASPTFTGIPKAPTAVAGTNTTQLATTAFVAALGALKAPVNAPEFNGMATFNGGWTSNNYACRLSGYAGNIDQGLLYFGSNDSYIFNDGVRFIINLTGVGTAQITKGGTVAMTSDLTRYKSVGGTGDSVGVTIMALSSGASASIDTDVSGSTLTPCNGAGIVSGAVRSGTWRCRGYSPAMGKFTIWEKIAA